MTSTESEKIFLKLLVSGSLKSMYPEIRNKISLLVTTLLILFTCFGILNAKVYHVKTTGNDDNDGLSWDKPFATFQKALETVVEGDQIWVAEGVYNPTSDWGLNIGPRGKHFRLVEYVQVYGGFPSNGEPSMLDRDHRKYKSILCGDLAGDDNWNEESEEWENREDNCYNVFYHPDGLEKREAENKENETESVEIDKKTLLDGFIIRKANGYFIDQENYKRGGGMLNYYCQFTINNCLIIDNYATDGGGISNLYSKIIVTNTKFLKNIALFSGGGIFNYYSDIHFVNCLIAENKLIGNILNHGCFGGGIYSYYGTEYKESFYEMTLTNCTVTNNFANESAGGIMVHSQNYTWFSIPVGNVHIRNSIIWGNTDGTSSKNSDDDFFGAYVGQVIEEGEGWNLGKFILENCLTGPIQSFVGSALTYINTLQYSDPMFIGKGEHPYLIHGLSPAVDAGINDFIDEEYDIRGNGFGRKLSRLDGQPGTVDIGAYEYQYGKDPVSVNEENDYVRNVKLYPNPVRENLYIESETIINQIELSDNLGRIVSRQHNTEKIDVSGLAPGLYLLKLYTAGGEVLTEKVVVN